MRASSEAEFTVPPSLWAPPEQRAYTRTVFRPRPLAAKQLDQSGALALGEGDDGLGRADVGEVE